MIFFSGSLHDAYHLLHQIIGFVNSMKKTFPLFLTKIKKVLLCFKLVQRKYVMFTQCHLRKGNEEKIQEIGTLRRES